MSMSLGTLRILKAEVEEKANGLERSGYAETAYLLRQYVSRSWGKIEEQAGTIEELREVIRGVQRVVDNK